MASGGGNWGGRVAGRYQKLLVWRFTSLSRIWRAVYKKWWTFYEKKLEAWCTVYNWITDVVSCLFRMITAIWTLCPLKFILTTRRRFFYAKQREKVPQMSTSKFLCFGWLIPTTLVGYILYAFIGRKKTHTHFNIIFSNGLNNLNFL